MDVIISTVPIDITVCSLVVLEIDCITYSALLVGGGQQLVVVHPN